MPKQFYLNVHAEQSCAAWSKLAFQNVSNEADIKSLKGLKIVEKDLNEGVLKHGDVFQVFVRVSEVNEDPNAGKLSYQKTDGTVVDSVGEDTAEEEEEVPF